jgi:hypothetical protein
MEELREHMCQPYRRGSNYHVGYSEMEIGRIFQHLSQIVGMIYEGHVEVKNYIEDSHVRVQ